MVKYTVKVDQIRYVLIKQFDLKCHRVKGSMHYSEEIIVADEWPNASTIISAQVIIKCMKFTLSRQNDPKYALVKPFDSWMPRRKAWLHYVH